MKSTVIVVIAVMFLVSPAFAATATVEADRSRANPGDVVTVTGRISDIAANSSVFDYRGACVAPSRVVIYDTGRVQTGADGSFSFSCAIPSLENLSASGVPAVSARSVIPIVVGVAYNDSGSMKKAHGVVFVVNTVKLNEKLSKIEEQVKKTLSRMDGFAARVDSLLQRANKSGGARAVEDLQWLKAHIGDIRNTSAALLAKLREAKQAGDAGSLRELLRAYEGGLKNIEKYVRFSKEELSKVDERRGGRVP